jgi:adenosylcobinamide kinase / adenosylcobinamide-phosphate guanylyltransferase
VSAGSLILIGGGARSGKSRFALARAAALGAQRVFVATAQAFDDEMARRIALHRGERDASFRTVEEPLDLVHALRSIGRADVVVVDCLTLWLSNLLVRGDDEGAVLGAVAALRDQLAERRHHAIVVTNEVGMGIVPDGALARTFRDVAGIAHQELARVADEVHVAILGTVLRVKPGPVEASLP